LTAGTTSLWSIRSIRRSRWKFETPMALTVQRLDRPPRAVVVTEGLVDEIQVQVVEAEALQRRLERAPGAGFAGVLDPELGRDEKLLARDARGADRAADRFLVLVGRGGVDVPVAGGERLADGALGLLRRDLVDAEAEDRDLDAVVQGQPGDVGRDAHAVLRFRP
jgi:hypothetical protein